MVDFYKDERVLVDLRDEVAILTLNRVDKLNALDDEMVELLCCLLEELVGSSIRCAVVTGAGKCFCSGYDLDNIDPEQPLGDPLPDARFERVVSAVEAFPVPVVAAIDGDVYGGGLDLALACDFRVARSGVGITMTACRLGLAYGVKALARYIEKMGPQVTRMLFLSGARITSEKAFELGLIDEVLEAGISPMERALEIGQEVARNAPLAVKAVRRTIQSLESARGESLQNDNNLDALRLEAFGSRDLREGLAAWKTRRRPRFLGR